MDDFELQQVLESMAGAFDPATSSSYKESFEDTVQRWQHLFQLSEDEATDRLVEHRNNLGRLIVSDEHWSAVREQEERNGFDQESYEYALSLEKAKVTLPQAVPVSDDAANSKITFLVEMAGPLSTVGAVQEVAGMSQEPEVVTGRSLETWDDVQLCLVDAKAKAKILQWAATSGKGYQPNILVNPKSLEQ